MLAAKLSNGNWKHLDQSSAMDPIADLNETEGIYFPLEGQCSTHEEMNIAEQWMTIYDPLRGYHPYFQNLGNFSCLNGWTFGNIIAKPLDVAAFYYYIGIGKLVSLESLEEAWHFDPLTVGWSIGLPYGLGFMVSDLFFSLFLSSRSLSLLLSLSTLISLVFFSPSRARAH